MTGASEPSQTEEVPMRTMMSDILEIPMSMFVLNRATTVQISWIQRKVSLPLLRTATLENPKCQTPT